MIEIILMCDACGFRYGSSRKQATKAREQAAQAGWSNPRKGVDFCPTHTPAQAGLDGEEPPKAISLPEHWTQVRSGHFLRKDGLLLEAGVRPDGRRDSAPVACWIVGVSDAPVEGPGLDEVYPVTLPDGHDLSLPPGPVRATVLGLEQAFPFRPDIAEKLAKAPRSKTRRIVPS